MIGRTETETLTGLCYIRFHLLFDLTLSLKEQKICLKRPDTRTMGE